MFLLYQLKLLLNDFYIIQFSLVLWFFFLQSKDFAMNYDKGLVYRLFSNIEDMQLHLYQSTTLPNPAEVN